MIIGKLWRSIKAQMNKVANFFWGVDPIAQLQYEYDKLVDQLKEGRVGLEQYQALVERVERQVKADQAHVAILEAKTRTYLAAGDRETAAKFALEVQKAKKNLAENAAQLAMHEQAYTNNLTKIKFASKKLSDLRDRIQKYDADLKMSRAEAEMARIAQSFNVDITTDFGEIEQVIQDQIDRNRARAKVAADLSTEGLEEVQREMETERVLAEDALKQFEKEEGISAERPVVKQLGPG
jgi:phage shock protein A